MSKTLRILCFSCVYIYIAVVITFGAASGATVVRPRTVAVRSSFTPLANDAPDQVQTVHRDVLLAAALLSIALQL
jgi:hypothetical protein